MPTKEIKALVKSVDDDGTFNIIASTATEDRDGDSLEVYKWDLKNFEKNPVILPMHKSDELPVGKAVRVWIEDNMLKAKIKFASKFYEYARLIENLYREGFMKAFSVGYVPGEKSNELLEISTVPVPANPEALLTLGYKSIDETKKKVKEGEMNKWLGDKEIKKDEEPKDEKKEKPKEKSPACRMADETKAKCVARKIPELIDEGMEREQAVAVANSVCEKICDAKEPKKDTSPEKIKVEEDIKNQIRDAIDTNKQAAEVLSKILQSMESTKGDNAESKSKVVIRADKSKQSIRRKAKKSYRALESLLKELKN